jgi:hypothetical protein
MKLKVKFSVRVATDAKVVLVQKECKKYIFMAMPVKRRCLARLAHSQNNDLCTRSIQ